ncbi:hypothetical protein H6P81_005283 [Aristolochia fimbriata]|uniref:Uncharacterized protein n=1 Tax=Aristolochia fimbriata TaxID=158543 RepID=A0AAV7EVF5_ARIFI|nr:hypothetical protein H6P81_005283 [Aristolochia fimbriata]
MNTLPEMNEGKILSDAWEYKGRPAVRSRTGGWTAAAMILGVELFERLTTLGIAVNLVTYLTGTMHLGNASSANTVTNFLGTSFMLCLLGGFVADTFLGRYLTIAIFATVQATGVTVLTISTIVPSLRPPPCGGGTPCTAASGLQLTVLYLALYLTALGTGGLKSSVSGFGSDQFDESDGKEKAQMTNFFNWFFFFISIGSLGAVTVLVYIQDNLGRKWGYGVCAAGILLGMVVFLSGTRRYRFKKLAGSPMTQVATVVVAAWKKRKLEPPSDASLLYDVHDLPGSGKKQKKQKLPHTHQFRFLDRAAIRDSEETTGSWRMSTVTDVEEVKLVIRMLPIWATTIMFWTVYAQMTTFSVSQATTMDVHIGKSFKIPPASLTVFFVGAILLTVPIYDKLIAPICRKFTHNPQGLSPLQRIWVGLLLSILAMVAAALTEIKRLRVAESHGLTDDDPEAAEVPLTVFWLIPQFLLVGSGEAFTYTGQLDFFLRECPKGMKTMSTGLFLSTLSLGFFFSSTLVSIVHRLTGTRNPWLADNLNRGRLYDFYWLLAMLSVVNIVLFTVAARWYEYKDSRNIVVNVAEEDVGDEEEEGEELKKVVVEAACQA